MEVRYSKKFLREQRRQDGKRRVLGAALLLALAIDLAVQSLRAFRAHVWVDLGSHFNQPVLFPPIVGALAATVLLLVSAYLLWTR